MQLYFIYDTLNKRYISVSPEKFTIYGFFKEHEIASKAIRQLIHTVPCYNVNDAHVLLGNFLGAMSGIHTIECSPYHGIKKENLVIRRIDLTATSKPAKTSFRKALAIGFCFVAKKFNWPFVIEELEGRGYPENPKMHQERVFHLAAKDYFNNGWVPHVYFQAARSGFEEAAKSLGINFTAYENGFLTIFSVHKEADFNLLVITHPNLRLQRKMFGSDIYPAIEEGLRKNNIKRFFHDYLRGKK